MEIPPYHIPTFKGVMLRTWDRVKTFMFRAGRVIVMIVACIAFFNSLGTDGSFGNEDTDKAVLSQVGKTIVPLFEPMGVQEENWPAAVGIFTGVLAKEAVVGTLNSLYDTIAVNEEKKAAEAAPAEGAAEEAPVEEEAWSFGAIFSEAVGTIGENFAGLASAFTDPLGITVGDLSEEEAAAEEQGVSTSTIDTIKVLFGSSTAAFAYLLMVLLYLLLGIIFHWWHPAWILFLTVPVFYMGIYRGYPILAACLYLVAGSCFSWWAWAWVVFLTIPIFYGLYHPRKNRQ